MVKVLIAEGRIAFTSSTKNYSPKIPWFDHAFSCHSWFRLEKERIKNGKKTLAITVILSNLHSSTKKKERTYILGFLQLSITSVNHPLSLFIMMDLLPILLLKNANIFSLLNQPWTVQVILFLFLLSRI